MGVGAVVAMHSPALSCAIAPLGCLPESLCLSLSLLPLYQPQCSSAMQLCCLFLLPLPSPLPSSCGSRVLLLPLCVRRAAAAVPQVVFGAERIGRRC